LTATRQRPLLRAEQAVQALSHAPLQARRSESAGRSA